MHHYRTFLLKLPIRILSNIQIKIEKRKFLVKTGKYLEDFILQTKLIKPNAEAT